MGSMIGVIACGGRKLNHPAPARSFYTGQYFQLVQEWIIPRCDEYVILSGKYGVVRPHQILEPYEFRLSWAKAAVLREWQTKVRAQIDLMFPKTDFITTGGKPYRAVLPPDRSICPWDEFRVTIGHQIHWLITEIENPTWRTDLIRKKVPS